MRELARDAKTAVMVQAVTTAAHALGMAVTAEGIETDAELAEVPASRCDWGQGSSVATPLPGEAVQRRRRSGRFGVRPALPRTG